MSIPTPTAATAAASAATASTANAAGAPKTTAVLTRSMYRSVLKHVNAIQHLYNSGNNSNSNKPSLLPENPVQPPPGTASTHGIISAVFCNLLPADAVIDFARQPSCGFETAATTSAATTQKKNTGTAAAAPLQPIDIAKKLFRTCVEHCNRDKTAATMSEEQLAKKQRENLLYGFEAVRRLSLMEQAATKYRLELRRAFLNGGGGNSSNNGGNNGLSSFQYPLVACVRSSSPELSPFDLPPPFVGTPISCVSDRLRFTPEELKAMREHQKKLEEEEKQKQQNPSSRLPPTVPPLDPRVSTLHEQLALQGTEPLYPRTLILDKGRLPLPPPVFFAIMVRSAELSQGRPTAASITSNSNSGNDGSGTSTTNVAEALERFVANARELNPLPTVLAVDTPIAAPRSFEAERKLEAAKSSTKQQDQQPQQQQDESAAAESKSSDKQQQSSSSLTSILDTVVKSGGKKLASLIKKSKSKPAAADNNNAAASRPRDHGFVRVVCTTQCVATNADADEEEDDSTTAAAAASVTSTSTAAAAATTATPAGKSGKGSVSSLGYSNDASRASKDQPQQQQQLHPFLEKLRQERKLHEQQQRQLEEEQPKSVDAKDDDAEQQQQNQQQKAQSESANSNKEQQQSATPIVNSSNSSRPFQAEMTYKVRIENHSNDFAVIILSRHWHFATFADGALNIATTMQSSSSSSSLSSPTQTTLAEVCGPGVVGYMPLLGPTAVTSYESGTSLKHGKYGLMLGKFQCIAIPYSTIREVQFLQEREERRQRENALRGGDSNKQQRKSATKQQKKAVEEKRPRRGQMMDEDEDEDDADDKKTASGTAEQQSSSRPRRSTLHFDDSSSKPVTTVPLTAANLGISLAEIDPATGYPRGGFCFDINIGPVALDPTVRRYEAMPPSRHDLKVPPPPAASAGASSSSASAASKLATTTTTANSSNKKQAQKQKKLDIIKTKKQKQKKPIKLQPELKLPPDPLMMNSGVIEMDDVEMEEDVDEDEDDDEDLEANDGRGGSVVDIFDDATSSASGGGEGKLTVVVSPHDPGPDFAARIANAIRQQNDDDNISKNSSDDKDKDNNTQSSSKPVYMGRTVVSFAEDGKVKVRQFDANDNQIFETSLDDISELDGDAIPGIPGTSGQTLPPTEAIAAMHRSIIQRLNSNPSSSSSSSSTESSSPTATGATASSTTTASSPSTSAATSVRSPFPSLAHAPMSSSSSSSPTTTFVSRPRPWSSSLSSSSSSSPFSSSKLLARRGDAVALPARGSCPPELASRMILRRGKNGVVGTTHMLRRGRRSGAVRDDDDDDDSLLPPELQLARVLGEFMRELMSLDVDDDDDNHRRRRGAVRPSSRRAIKHKKAAAATTTKSSRSNLNKLKGAAAAKATQRSAAQRRHIIKKKAAQAKKRNGGSSNKK